MNVLTVSNVYRFAIAVNMITSAIILMKSSVITFVGCLVIMLSTYLFKRFGFKCDSCGGIVSIKTNVINPENAFDKYAYDKCCGADDYIIANKITLYIVIAITVIYISFCVWMWNVL